MLVCTRKDSQVVLVCENIIVCPSTQSLCSEPTVAARLLHKWRTSVRGEIFMSAASGTSPFPHASSKEEVGLDAMVDFLLHTLMLRVKCCQHSQMSGVRFLADTVYKTGQSKW